MKDTTNKTITEHEFTKDIGYRTESTMTTEKWREEFETKVNDGDFGLNVEIETDLVKDYISTLLSKERNKVLDEVKKEVEKTVTTKFEGYFTGKRIVLYDDILILLENLKV